MREQYIHNYKRAHEHTHTHTKHKIVLHRVIPYTLIAASRHVESLRNSRLYEEMEITVLLTSASCMSGPKLRHFHADPVYVIAPNKRGIITHVSKSCYTYVFMHTQTHKLKKTKMQKWKIILKS
jgi:hypothetical protein